MSIRAMLSIDVERNNRMYHILIENNSPYDDVQAVLADVSDMLKKQQQAEVDRIEAAKAESQEVQVLDQVE